VNTSGDRSSPRDSFASNIFDNQDSLSKGIREYVDSKVAEAMVAYDRTHCRKAHGSGKDTHITFKIDVAGLARRLDGKTDKKPTLSPTPNPKHICGYTISSLGLVHALSGIILALYMFALGYLFCGLSAPLLFVFVLSVVSFVKVEKLHLASQSVNADNMVFAPLLLIWQWVQGVVRAMIMGLMKIAVECVEELASETDVDVEVGRHTA
jgi:hypothetical protein